MGKDFIENLNTVFSSYQEVRMGEIQKDKRKVRQAVLDGLSNSCEIFRKILDQPALRNAGSDPRITEYLNSRRLTDEFLRTEQRLLALTAISPALAKELLALADDALRSSVLSSSGWRDDLKPLRDEVCKQAAVCAGEIRLRHLLKRAIVAGGGSTITMLNLSPPFAMAPHFMTASTTVGLWLIAEAAKDHLADYFNR